MLSLNFHKFLKYSAVVSFVAMIFLYDTKPQFAAVLASYAFFALGLFGILDGIVSYKNKHMWLGDGGISESTGKKAQVVSLGYIIGGSILCIMASLMLIAVLFHFV